jgi:hypothetical protein
LREGIVTLTGAVSASESYGLVVSGLRARVNLSYVAAGEDPRLAYQVVRDGVDLLRRLGMRDWPYMLSNAIELALRIGDWDWILPELDEAVANGAHPAAQMRRAEIQGLRGMDVEAELRDLAETLAGVTEVQAQASLDEVRASVALAHGDASAALEFARRSYAGFVAPDSTAVSTATRAAAALGDGTAARAALEALQRVHGRVPETATREAAAVVAIIEGRRDEGVIGFIDAIRRWRDLGLEFEAAMCVLTLVTMVGATDSEARDAAEQARMLFERVGASPHLVLLDQAMGAVRSAPPTRRDAPIVDDVATFATHAD